MLIMRQCVPFYILREINDPAFWVLRDAYACIMEIAEADAIMEKIVERRDALTDSDMGWGIPSAGDVKDEFMVLDMERPLDDENLPPFEGKKIPLRIERENIVLFYSEKSEYGCFSQWYAAPFTVEGIRYATAEQYMMARKALLFNDYTIYQDIMAESEPRKCKDLGRKVRHFKPAVWDACKQEIVFHANFAKFTQNEELREILLGTGDAILAEASPSDRIWGIGMRADDPKAQFTRCWNGANLLGRTLMSVRERLAAEG